MKSLSLAAVVAVAALLLACGGSDPAVDLEKASEAAEKTRGDRESAIETVAPAASAASRRLPLLQRASLSTWHLTRDRWARLPNTRPCTCSPRYPIASTSRDSPMTGKGGRQSCPTPSNSLTDHSWCPSGRVWASSYSMPKSKNTRLTVTAGSRSMRPMNALSISSNSFHRWR